MSASSSFVPGREFADGFAPSPEEEEEEEQPRLGAAEQSALDEAVTEVQDAFFEGRYRRAIDLAHAVLERYEGEEDTYDMLLASFLALGEYEDVIVSAQNWVAVCGESLRQLMHLLEAAYMIDQGALVEDASFKLCYLFESSQHDPVFAAGAVLGAALALDMGLPFPDCIDPKVLLGEEAVAREPLVWWLKRRLQSNEDLKYECGKDDQANDFQKCLLALETHEKDKDAVNVLLAGEPVDATGVAARHLFCGRDLVPNPALSRVHPLFRKRLIVKLDP